jgi:Regulator of chromosome condensation (RCC1) repeat
MAALAVVTQVLPAAAAVIATGVLSGRTIVQISAGGQHTCALGSTGLAYAAQCRGR